MKILFIIIFLFVSIFSWGQNCTQKYNKLYDRTEFYNSYGNLIGYAQYNSLYNRLEYYSANGNLLKTEQYNSSYNRKETKDKYGNQQGYEKKMTFITEMRNTIRMVI